MYIHITLDSLYMRARLSIAEFANLNNVKLLCKSHEFSLGIVAYSIFPETDMVKMSK